MADQTELPLGWIVGKELAMLTLAQQEAIARHVRTLQIIVGSLVAGVLMFLAIATVVARADGGGRAGQAPVLTYVAAVFAIAAVLAAWIARTVIVARGRRRIVEGTWQLPQRAYVQTPPERAAPAQITQSLEQTGDAGKLLFVFQTRTIVSAAELEGAAFFAVISYLLERHPPAMILAIILIAGVAAHLPTRGRVIRWIEEQLRLVEDERRLAR
jgi:hypothetical protein